MTAIAIAAGVLTVSATSTRITAATVAPTCGMRSSRPVIRASTMGNGRPNAHADRPATVAATSDTATLPISDEDTAPIESSSTGRHRASVAGPVKPNSQSVIVGRSMSRNSERNVRVTSDKIDPKTPPAMPRRVFAASGSPAARSLRASVTVSLMPAVEAISWNAAELVRSSHRPGSAWTNSTISSHTGPAVTTTSATTAANNPANTATAARPRAHPRRTMAPTTGSRPMASTAATKIDSSVPNEAMASATKAPKARTVSSVRGGMTISTRWGGGSTSASPPDAAVPVDHDPARRRQDQHHARPDEPAEQREGDADHPELRGGRGHRPRHPHRRAHRETGHADAREQRGRYQPAPCDPPREQDE